MWRVIEDFPSYEISQEGAVRVKKSQQLKKTTCNGRGYALHRDGKDHTVKASLLLEQAFPSANVWKTVEGYESYVVSPLGVIAKAACRTIMKQTKNSSGYFQIGLTKNGKQTTHTVHRIVATAFIPNIDGKPCIDHIDRNKGNNIASNLRWATYSENGCNKHGISSTEVRGVCFRPSRNKYEVSISINKKSVYVGMYDSLEQATEARYKAEEDYHHEFGAGYSSLSTTHADSGMPTAK